MSANANAERERGQHITLVKRSQDLNGKAMLAQAMQNINWTPLYNMQSCEEMVACSYSTVITTCRYLPSDDTQLTNHGSLTDLDS